MKRSHADLSALANRMPIPTPWDRDAFVSAVAEMRGRPITLIPIDTRGLIDSPCGLWLNRDHDDLLLHETGTSSYHIDQIVCHELGHMILGHDRPVATGLEHERERTVQMCSKILPDLDPETVNAVLTRGQYSDDQELDAELFASLLVVAVAESAASRSMMRSVFFRRR